MDVPLETERRLEPSVFHLTAVTTLEQMSVIGHTSPALDTKILAQHRSIHIRNVTVTSFLYLFIYSQNW